MNKLSVIIPCYNEELTIKAVIEKLIATDLGLSVEVIVVDDGSTDNTARILKDINYPNVQIFSHGNNQGKGAAIQTALQSVTGEYVVIQDADLEYSPTEITNLLNVIRQTNAKVVYGSRNLNPTARGQWIYYLGGVFLSVLANILYNQKLTDIATCYKMVDTKLLRKCQLTEKGFGFCYEVTAKLCNMGVQITEVPISYNPRSRAEGKKIKPKDGLEAIWLLFRYKFWQA